MTRILRDDSVDRSQLPGPVAVIGYGNQGAAQALCLRDSGLTVSVLTRPGSPSRERARADSFAPAPPHALGEADSIALLVPDEAQPEVLQDLVHPHAKEGALLVFAHGFALREANLHPRSDLDLVLVGPLGPGALLRERYEAGSGLPGLFAVVRDSTGKAGARGLAYAGALGMTRAGLLPTTLEEEVVSDLFAEQTVLAGGVVELMRTAWEVLVEGGVSEEVAYYSCVQELKQMLDLIHARGPAGMREMISGTAQYGGLTRGPRVIGDEARQAMRAIWAEIKSGRFGEEWLTEHGEGGGKLAREREAEAAHPLEAAGRRVREGLGGAPGSRPEVDSPPLQT